MTGSERDRSSSRRLLPAIVRRSFLAKLLAVLLVVVILVGGVSAYTYTQTSHELKRQTRTQYVQLADHRAKSIANWRTERTVNARMLSQYEIVVSNDPFKIDAFLLREKQRLPSDVLSLRYADLDNRTVVASDAPTRTRRSLTRENSPWAYRNATFRDRVLVSRVYRVNGTPEVAFVSHVPTTDGSNRALVITSNFSAVVSEFTHATEGSFGQVVDGSGHVLASTGATGKPPGASNGGPGARYANGSDSPVVAAARNGSAGFLSGSNHGGASGSGNYVTAYAPVSGAGWAVAVHVPTNQAYALRTGVTRNLLLLVIVILLGLGFIAATFGRGTVTALNALSRKAAALEAGDLDVDLAVDRADEIGGLFASFAGMRDSLKERIEESERERREAEREREHARIARERSEELTQSMQRTATAFGAVMRRCADGDLTARIETDTESEAMADIATEFNEMVADLERTVAGAARFADEVASASAATRETADEVESTGQEVSASIDQISTAAVRQNDHLRSVAVEADEMSATIEEVAASADQVAETSRAAARLGTDGRDAAGDAVDELHDIERQTEKTAAAVESLDRRMNEIGDIVDVIGKIADQTNILALNASIEAARAGESGDGFAVVANEVKSLAEETKQSAKEIESLIGDVQERTAASTTEMTEISGRVDSGVESVETTHDRLTAIVKQVEEADNGVQEITDAMDSQATSMQEVATTVDELAGISEETTAEARTVASAAEQQTSALGTVSERVDQLAERATHLRQSLDGFEVREAITGREAPGSNAASFSSSDSSSGSRPEDRFAARVVGDGGRDGSNDRFDWATLRPGPDERL